MPSIETPVRVVLSTYELINDSRNAKPSITNIRTTNSYGKGSELRVTNTNPNWKVQLAKRIDATTPYFIERHTVIPGRVEAETFQRQSWYTIRADHSSTVLGSIPTSFTLTDNLLASQASAVMKRKLRSSIGQVNGIVPVVELREMRGMLRSTVKSATTLVSTLLDIRRTKGRSAGRYASDVWLNFSFGIAPTIGAIQEVSESINKYMTRKDRVLKEFAFAKTDWKTGTYYSGTGPFGCYLRSYGDFQWSRSCKLTASFVYQLKSANSYGLSDQLGFTKENIVPAIWELVPYSWLIDYFTTAGSYFEDAFSADFGQSIYITSNFKLTVSGDISHRVVPFSRDVNLIHVVTRNTHFRYFAFNRSSLSNLPRAPLRFRSFDEIGHNATNKLLNLTSLLGSRLKK